MSSAFTVNGILRDGVCFHSLITKFFVSLLSLRNVRVSCVEFELNSIILNELFGARAIL